MLSQRLSSLLRIDNFATFDVQWTQTRWTEMMRGSPILLSEIPGNLPEITCFSRCQEIPPFGLGAVALDRYPDSIALLYFRPFILGKQIMLRVSFLKVCCCIGLPGVFTCRQPLPLM